MKTTTRNLRSAALSAAFILVFLTLDIYGGHLLTGFKYGYTSALTEVRYIESYSQSARLAPKPEDCRSLTIGYVSDDNQVSFIGDMFTQKSDDKSAFTYLGLSVEYRFFKNIDRSWNPYISVGAAFLFYLDFGGGPPDYPKTAAIQATTGARISVVGPIYLNPQVAYNSGTSGLSFLIGLDLIF